MRVDVLPFQNVHQLHLNGVATTIADGTFRTGSYNQVVLILRCTLFECTDGVFSNVTTQPFVNSSHTVPSALQLVNGHRANFQQTVRKKVFDALFRGSQFHTVRFSTGRVLQASLRHKLQKRSLRPSQCCTDR